ncbi:hypothetical protein HTVC203P_gp39 [Pelagibacter phage HTVC203P]|nr:hypothetical protein HTVC203P_gp39 [Pelagibacter phage HTVC203P]
MAYIGKSPVIGNFVKLDAITAVNGQAAYTMQNGGSNFTDYESVNQFLVSLNGTIQAPTDSFTVSGSTLTFASNLSTGDVIDFIMVFGNSLSAGTPTDATVSTAKIVDDAVTAAKINDDIISGATELAATPADTDEFLVSDAGTIKRIDYSYIKGSSDWVKLASSDATSVSSIEFQDVFTTDYRHYRIIGADINPNNDQLVFQFLTSGSTAITSGYYSIAEEVMGNSTTTANQNTKRWNGDDINVVEQNTGTDLTQAAWFDMTLVNPTDSASYRSGVLTSGQFANNGQLYNLNKSFTQISTGSSYGGIKFQGNGSQTINHAKITIYGVK